MFRTAATRVAARAQTSRKFSTAQPKLNHLGQSEGGHLPTLQREPPFMQTWMNFKGSSEIIPMVFILTFAGALAGYKMFVVDGMKKPFVSRFEDRK